VYGSKEGAEKVEDFSLFSGKNTLTLAEDYDEQVKNGWNDNDFSLDDFTNLFSEECKKEAEEIYMLISSTDGKEGLSNDEWMYTAALNNDGGMSLDDMKEVVKEAQEEYTAGQKETESGSAVTIKSGDTPIGIMKQMFGEDYEFNMDDYNALMQMNINAGNIQDSYMTEEQKEKYGVNYMLQPDMQISKYDLNAIKDFQKTGKMPVNQAADNSKFTTGGIVKPMDGKIPGTAQSGEQPANDVVAGEETAKEEVKQKVLSKGVKVQDENGDDQYILYGGKYYNLDGSYAEGLAQNQDNF